MPSKINELKLYKLAQAGSRQAFNAIQRRLEPDVKRYVRHLLGETDLENDIAQDAIWRETSSSRDQGVYGALS